MYPVHFFGLLYFSSVCCPDSSAAVIDGVVYRDRNEQQGAEGKEEHLKVILVLDMNLILNPRLFRYTYCSTLHCRKLSVISVIV